MSFRYLAGITTPGAPDEIINWFATFQAWVATAGWSVAAGGGTTDLYLRSASEDGGLMMLYLHVWRDLGNPNRVRIEVQDDLAGTHATNEAGFLDGAGAQFSFWMCGDKDAISICFLGGVTYHTIYAGLVMPFAMTVADETYSMIATSSRTDGSILRDSDGTWDVDHNLTDSAILDNADVDAYDASFPLCGTFFDAGANIAGQLKHVSGHIDPAALVVQTLLTTSGPEGQTDWIVLQDRFANRYAMRTGGVKPTGSPEVATFAAVTGIATNLADLWTALSTHLVGLGWADLGDPGHHTEGRLYYSQGESGVDEIYIGYSWNNAVTDEFFPYVQDDAVGTHRFPTTYLTYLGAGYFPINYWICGDLDCCVLVFQKYNGYNLIWSGLVPAFAPGLRPPYPGPALSEYQMFAGMQQGPVFANILAGQLRRHNGVWAQPAVMNDDGAGMVNSNPNNFDGTTYLVWPILAHTAVNWEFLGQLRYVGRSSGGGIGSMDTITLGEQVYTSFVDGYFNNFMVRTL